jgi:diguanylate cyclase (GGDEF)-like protein/PAS domain S-box-containing protein
MNKLPDTNGDNTAALPIVQSENGEELIVGGRRILVADDDRSIVLVVEHQIRLRIGCAVGTVTNGDEVLLRLAEEKFDVLVTDMVMPGMHGLELVARVRETYPDIGIIVMTGFADDFPYVDVVRAGANDFIMKPYLGQELEAKLIRIFREAEMRDALVLAETKYRSIFEYGMSGMLLMSREGFRIIDVNQAFCEFCGRNKDDVVHSAFSNLLDTSAEERFSVGLELCASGGRGTLGDVSLLRPDGTQVWADISVTYMDVLSQQLISLVFKDVTERREVEQDLADAAQRDSLTGLLNKRTFLTTLAGAISRAQNENLSVVLVFIDLDNFKKCNDNHGHQAGDKLLTSVGQLITHSIRKGGDLGFRYGGDEFGVLLMGATIEVAQRIAERMRGDFQALETYGTSMSIGVAEYKHNMSVSTLVSAADAALYRAKALGKNTVCVA